MKKSSVRKLEEIRLEQLLGEIRITYLGNGFLYNMVRILTWNPSGSGDRKTLSGGYSRDSGGKGTTKGRSNGSGPGSLLERSQVLIPILLS